MTVIVTYDVSAEWVSVKQEAFKFNFYNLVQTQAGNRVLPNTTLFIDNVTSLDAMNLFDQAVENARRATGKPIVLEKVVTGTTNDWRCKSDRNN